MMKYRIISRNKYPDGSPCNHLNYFAQMNVFGIWVDCILDPFVDTFNSYDMKLEVVEKWVNSQLKKKEPLKEEVVKTYD